MWSVSTALNHRHQKTFIVIVVKSYSKHFDQASDRFINEMYILKIKEGFTIFISTPIRKFLRNIYCWIWLQLTVLNWSQANVTKFISKCFLLWFNLLLIWQCKYLSIKFILLIQHWKLCELESNRGTFGKNPWNQNHIPLKVHSIWPYL